MYDVFFFNDTATTEIYTLSLHDALPIYGATARALEARGGGCGRRGRRRPHRSEEHTSELQSPCNLVCRLLLEKKQSQPRRCPLGLDWPGPPRAVVCPCGVPERTAHVQSH